MRALIYGALACLAPPLLASLLFAGLLAITCGAP